MTRTFRCDEGEILTRVVEGKAEHTAVSKAYRYRVDTERRLVDDRLRLFLFSYLPADTDNLGRIDACQAGRKQRRAYWFWKIGAKLVLACSEEYPAREDVNIFRFYRIPFDPACRSIQ
ncbi:MAG TPA: hypothetical protein VKB81_04015 [Nitrospira sp.]|nr:hypothetical protein [Nitrospira sp.]